MSRNLDNYPLFSERLWLMKCFVFALLKLPGLKNTYKPSHCLSNIFLYAPPTKIISIIRIIYEIEDLLILTLPFLARIIPLFSDFSLFFQLFQYFSDFSTFFRFFNNFKILIFIF